jgi:GT2 family glycosyltransferase
VVAVVVTHNRRELLLECLQAIDAQSRPVDEVIVVDNASADRTADAVAERFPGVRLHRLDENIGGAGGFAYGVAVARSDADLLWLMDDDVAPLPDALEQLLAARTGYPGPPPVIVASSVVAPDGQPIRMNVARIRPFASTALRRAAGEVGCTPIRSASFVSILIDGPACRGHDLPIADYFIWNDDFEYTTRLLRRGVGLLCPASVVRHATVSATDPGPRFRFEVRNKIWLLTRSRGLAPWERVLYGGATLRRWVAAIARSSDRGLLVRGLARGAKESLRAPRSTADVLGAVATHRSGGSAGSGC